MKFYMLFVPVCLDNTTEAGTTDGVINIEKRVGVYGRCNRGMCIKSLFISWNDYVAVGLTASAGGALVAGRG